MSPRDGEALRALLGGPAYRALFAAARERLEAAGDRARAFTLPDPGPEARDALAGLLGWAKVPGGPVRLRLDEIDAALRGSAAGASLVEVLEALGGPLRSLPEERSAISAAVERRWFEAHARLREAGRAELTGWLESLRRSGWLARVESSGGGERLLEESVAVALRLPAGGILLQVLAAEVTGDPHALDAGQPLASPLLRAAAHLAGWTEVPIGAAGRRALLAEVGVDRDPLSSDVLVLGLRPAGTERLARHLRECAEDGEPRRVTLRELGGAAVTVSTGTPVYVCENPSVLAAAAAAHGGRCAPLVCLEGVPSTAATRLLRSLREGGAVLRVRADFDWAGLRIAGPLIGLPGALPWRFRAADYLQALGARLRGLELEGPPAPAPWDPELAEEMRRAEVSVPEERVIDLLIGDLRG